MYFVGNTALHQAHILKNIDVIDYLELIEKEMVRKNEYNSNESNFKFVHFSMKFC